MAAVSGGFVQAITNGWNTLTLNVSKTCEGAYNLTHAGWQKMKEFGPVQKTADFANAYYPNALRFTWSTGTAVTTGCVALTTAKIIQWRDTEEKKVARDIAILEAKQEDLKKEGKDLSAGETELLAALKKRNDEIKPKK